MKKWLVLGVGLVLWELVSRSGLLPSYKLPGPILTLASFTSGMAYGTLATVFRTLLGFSLGVILAYSVVLLAIVTGTLRALDAQFSGARAVPFLAASPLFIMWLGIGEASRLIVVLLSVAAFVAGPLTESIRRIPREWTVQPQRYGKGHYWEFIHITIPGTLGAMIGPLRVALAIALTVAIAGDFMGSTIGIGRSVDSARVTFNTPAILLLIVISAAVGVGLDSALATSLRTAGHWLGRTTKA